MAGEGAAGAVLGVGWRELTAPELILANSSSPAIFPKFSPFLPPTRQKLKVVLSLPDFTCLPGPFRWTGDYTDNITALP